MTTVDPAVGCVAIAGVCLRVTCGRRSAALADPGDETAQQAADLWQYRFDGADPLAGHAVGNLLLTGLMELTGNPVLALGPGG